MDDETRAIIYIIRRAIDLRAAVSDTFVLDAKYFHRRVSYSYRYGGSQENGEFNSKLIEESADAKERNSSGRRHFVKVISELVRALVFDFTSMRREKATELCPLEKRRPAHML